MNANMRSLTNRYQVKAQHLTEALYQAAAEYIGSVHVAKANPGEQLDLVHMAHRIGCSERYDLAVKAVANLHDRARCWPHMEGLAKDLRAALASADDLVGDALKNA